MADEKVSGGEGRVRPPPARSQERERGDRLGVVVGPLIGYSMACEVLYIDARQDTSLDVWSRPNETVHPEN